MNIILIGEYSNLHNSLKEGLLTLGHNVLLVSSGDLFKNYPSDISLKPVLSEHKFWFFLRKGLHKLFNYDTATTERGIRFYANKEKFKGFDIVQLINEYAIETHLNWEKKAINFLVNNNKKLFLLACGDDYIINSYYLSRKIRYSVLSPYLNDVTLKNNYKYSLKYITKPFESLHNLVFKHISGVIPTDMDYAIPYKGQSKALPMIPTPINCEKIEFKPLQIEDKIIIFHGVNRMNYMKKGNNLIDEALEIIAHKYKEKVEIIRAESLPYNEYITSYDCAHIIMDQVYAFDQGYNALEAMAKGKVVCTGSEKEFEEHYGLTERVAINLLPDVTEIVLTLEELIINPEELVQIGKRARKFVETHHDYVKIAKQYIETWTKKRG